MILLVNAITPFIFIASYVGVLIGGTIILDGPKAKDNLKNWLKISVTAAIPCAISLAYVAFDASFWGITANLLLSINAMIFLIIVLVIFKVPLSLLRIFFHIKHDGYSKRSHWVFYNGWPIRKADSKTFEECRSSDRNLHIDARDRLHYYSQGKVLFTVEALRKRQQKAHAQKKSNATIKPR